MHNGGENYNGTTSRSSEQIAGLDKFSSVLREYCNVGDPICAPDSPNHQAENHINYFDKYIDDATEFIVAKATIKSVASDDEISGGDDGDSANQGSSEVQQGSVESDAARRSVGALAWFVAMFAAMMML